MKILTLGLFLGLSSVANAAGPSSGGGGYALQCKATVVEPAHVQLLDLYEGATLLDFKMATASGNLLDDYYSSVKRVYALQGDKTYPEPSHESANENVNKFFRRVVMVDSASQLPSASDLGALPEIPVNCSLEQVAYFIDSTDTIYILKPLFDQLDSVSQAALVLHELYYRDGRRLGDRTSELARRAVAHAFAIEGAIPTKDGLSALSRAFYGVTDVSDPSGDMSAFTMTPQQDPSLSIMQFSALAGRPLLTATWAIFPAIEWDLKFGRSKDHPEFVGCILATPNEDSSMVAAIDGTELTGLSLRYTVKTGEPIKLEVLDQAGHVQSTEFVDGGSTCEGQKIN